MINHGVLSESGSAVSARGLGDTLSREKDGAAIAGSGGVVSAIKPPYMYGSALESAGTDGAAAPRSETAVRAYYCFVLFARLFIHSSLH